MSASHATSRALPTLRWLLAAALVPLLLLALVAWHDRRVVFQNADARLSTMVDILQEHAERVFEAQELILEQVAHRVRGMTPRRLASGDIHTYLARTVERHPPIGAIAVIGADGLVHATSAGFPTRGVSVRDRDYYAFFAQGGHGIFVTAPYIGRGSGQRQFSLASASHGQDGRLEQVVLVSVFSDELSTFYARAVRERDAIANLVRADGHILARHGPGEPGLTPLPSTSYMTQAAAAGLTEGRFQVVSTVDGIYRLYRFRRLGGYPVYVVFGMSRDEILATWRGHVVTYSLFAVPASLVVLVLAGVAMGQARRLAGAVSDLEREIGQREAAEARLRQAQQLEAIGQLTGGVAHDFNNLLTVILGNAELIGREPSAQARALADDVRAAAERGAQLTRRLLAFARRQPLEPQVLDLDATVEGTRALLARTLGERVVVETRLAGALPCVVADPHQVENAVVNLAINARDAMPDGGRLVLATGLVALDGDAAAQREIPPGRYAVLTVTDAGTGMPPEVLARAFEPFFTTKGPGRGSGLGLSTIYGFAKQSGGHVEIASEVGRGTTVRLYLPLAPAGARPTVETRREPTAEAPGAPATILVVEDDDAVRQAVLRRLGALGYRTLAAADASSALEQLERHPEVSLLFTDVVMPGRMSGLDLAAAARGRAPGLPVLLTSGYSEDVLTHEASGHTFDLLPKPYRLDELAARVTALLGRAAPGPAGPGRPG
jgi:signal transduction histidine kinase/ActR/RegA family two-component response regulator